MAGIVDLQPLPHEAAIEYFRSKGYAPQLQRFHHLDHFREEHARNWVVAKAMRNDVSEAIRAEVERMLVEGRSIRQASADLAPRLQELGWWGKKTERDPQTGELVEVQLGSMRRLRTIFDTNMRTAHAAGHWSRIQRTKRAFPYLHYIQIDRPTKRHSHARFHDKIWHVDDPVWLRIYPPNGYFCGCLVIQRTEGWMKRNSRTVSERLDLDEVEWTNHRTGQTFDVPNGITPGFDTNPGAAWLEFGEAWPDASPEERGYLQGLRLRRLATGREAVIIINEVTGNASDMFDAAHANPASISIDTLAAQVSLPDRMKIFHSHLTDTPFSVEDFRKLAHPSIREIVAISPGGALWAARPAQELIEPKISAFARLALTNHREAIAGLPEQDRSIILQHGLGLFLERQGAIHYHHHETERLRQLYLRYRSLLQTLETLS